MIRNFIISCLTIIVCLSLVLYLSACSSKALSRSKEIGHNRSFPIPLATPLTEWLKRFPDDNNYTIGISKTTRGWKDMYEAAREMATVQYARNLSSYNIDNQIRVEKIFDERITEEHRSLIFQVSDAKQLWEIYDRLHLIEYYILHSSYLIALFQYQEQPVLADSLYADRKLEMTIADENISLDDPSWFSDKKIIISGHNLISHSSATSACLIDAWDKASQSTRFKFANYFSTSVEALLENVILGEYDKQRKVIALETFYNVENIMLSQAYICTFFLENDRRYKVFLEMKMDLHQAGNRLN